MNEFGYAMFLANSLYGLNMDSNIFEELGLIAFNQIGNKRTRLYKTCLPVECGSNQVQLPCNCDMIEAVTYGFEDSNYVSNTLPVGDLQSWFTEHYIEGMKAFKDPLYISGKYVNYERVGDTLYLNEPVRDKIFILYRGQLVDDNGLPQITDSEAHAIAAFCAYTAKYKEGLMTNNPQIIQTAQLLKQEWTKLCDQARAPEYLNQNDMNKILDAKTSWNRKVFNKSLKPV